MRRLVALLAMVAGLCGFVVSADEAGATYIDSWSSFECGFTPAAPNAVDTCSKWVASQHWGYPYSYKIDATHHYGWWGSSWDPGTWHIIAYLYYNGVLIGQVANVDVGDHDSPLVYNYGGTTGVSLEPAWMGNFLPYRNCANSNVTKDVWFSDTAGVGNWAQGNIWPFATDLYGGNPSGQCQHGFGSHGSAARIGPTQWTRVVSGVTTTHYNIELY